MEKKIGIACDHAAYELKEFLVGYLATKGFEKISLEPGETKTVTFEITPELMSYYNSELDFVAEPGEFRVFIGPDSRTKNAASFILK